jgi:predicted ester cyclase
MSKPDDIVTRYYAAFNARDFDAYAKLFSPDAEVVAPGVSARGVEAMRNFDSGWVGAFPEAHVETFRMDTAGQHVAACIWFHGGPQRAALGSPVGMVPAGGKVVECPGYAIFTIEGDRIVKQQLAFEPQWVALKLGLTH